MRALILILAFSVSLSAQAIIGGSSGGGGASAANDLSDVTITSRAADDILVDNGSGAYINEQILEAIGSRLMDGRVLFVDSGLVSQSPSLLWSSPHLSGVGGYTPAIRFGNVIASTPTYSWSSDKDTGWAYGGTTGVFRGLSDGVDFVTIGGAQTVLVKDTTATTGATIHRCEDGAGQGVTPCAQVESFAAFDGLAFADLSTQPNGSYSYCTDCQKATPCASGGSGAFAKRINGAWDCD